MILKQTLRYAVLVTLLCAFCTIIAACTTDPTGLADPTAAPAPSACQVNQLSLAYDTQQEGAANRADEFSVQNTTNTACILTRYPRLWVVNDVKKKINLHVTTATSGYFYQQISEQPIVLKAKARAYFVIEWAAGACSSRAAYQGVTLQFSLPGETRILTISMAQGAEGGPLYCGDHLELTVSPFTTKNVFA